MAAMSELIDHATCGSSASANGFEQGLQPIAMLLQSIEANYEARTWQVFLRTVVDQIPTDSVAAEFQMTPAGVRQIRSRVLRHLRRAMVAIR